MHADAKGQLSHVTSKSHTKAKQTTCSLYELYPMVKVLLNWPSPIICQVFYSHLHTVKSGCDYKELISSPWWDSPRSVQWAPGSGKTTHGGNYGIMLCQECSHDGQQDLMEVSVAGLWGLWVMQHTHTELHDQMSLVLVYIWTSSCVGSKQSFVCALVSFNC